jgi:arsenite methyltransferase
MPVTAADLIRRRGEYGLDAPYVPLWMGVAAIAAITTSFIGSVSSIPAVAIPALNIGLALSLSVADYVYASRLGKFAVWAELLVSLDLLGDERVLDLGCGRGAVLLMVAKLLPRGRAVGVDLWKTSDQSGNALDVTQRNAELEGVADRVVLRTGDVQSLPFEDESFDVVLSSLAIHNIAEVAGRAKAIDEAVRVLSRGGRILIVDINATREYEARLRKRGIAEVERRSLGPRMWFGGPWVAASLVRGRKQGEAYSAISSREGQSPARL